MQNPQDDGFPQLLMVLIFQIIEMKVYKNMERFILLLLFTSVLGTSNAESYDKTKDAELAIKKFSPQVRR